MGAVTHARVLDGVGEQAAQGQMASLGEAVVLDRIVTEEAHRRRGLGNFVMRTLAGRVLYETLGWKKHATLAEYVYRL